MDPTATLDAIRRVVTEYHESEFGTSERTETAETLIDLVESLDQWLAGGGFLPEQWRH